MDKAIDPPVTVTVSRQVKPGCEVPFERLVSDLCLEAKRFPGYLGTDFFKPDGHCNDYRVIFKFDCLSHFHQWQISPVRVEAYQKIDALLVKPPHIEILTGLETWFEVPGQSGPLVPPPRYKMAIVSWLAIYPLVVLILTVLNPLLLQLVIPVKAAVITLIAIPTMTYVLMPRMTRLFSAWLYPKRSPAMEKT